MPLARYSLYAWGSQRHIAKEARVYVVGCAMALRKEDIADQFEYEAKYYSEVGEWINKGTAPS